MTKGVLEMKGNKTNKTMRVAGGLLIATLLSTSIVSGTFAKYVTTGSASDSARVAKFGVVVTANGTLFSTTYLSKSGGNIPGGSATTGLTVKSSDTKKVVAPGTQNDTGLTFSITGTPEVDVKVQITATGTNDIWLGAGTYADMTTSSNATDTFAVSEAYYPIVYTLKKNGSEVKSGTLSEINTALESETTTYAAGTDLSSTTNGVGTYTLTWKWAFGSDSGIDDVDRKDTLLGDLIAGTTITPDTNNAAPASAEGLTASANSYNANVDAEFTITVTQVD
jgi:hypothetical protein